MGAGLRGRCRPGLCRPGPVDFPYRLPNHYFSILVRVYQGYRGDGEAGNAELAIYFFEGLAGAETIFKAGPVFHRKIKLQMRDCDSPRNRVGRKK